MDDFLSKPFTQQQLAALLKRWLAHADAARVRSAWRVSRVPLVDVGVLRNIAALARPALLNSLIDLYMQHSPVLMAAIESAAAEMQAGSARRGIARAQIKHGQSRRRAARDAREGMRSSAARGRQLPSAAPLVQRIRREYQEFCAALDARKIGRTPHEGQRIRWTPLKTAEYARDRTHRRRRSRRTLLLGTALEMAGFRVTYAADGASALQQFQAAPRRLRHARRGHARHERFRRVQRLARLPECRHVPILMQTSLDDMESVNRAYNAGATDFSSKGINPMLLAQRVKFLVRAKQTQDQLRESEARVRYLAYYDPLTALPNRQRLLQILEQHVEWAVPRQRGIAVLMLDIDNFSRINDTQGQAVGDVLLQEVANRLQYCLAG